MYNVKMSDTQWHIGYAKKKDDDPRRHKARCVYYHKMDGICKMKTNTCSGKKCPGSSHCKFYSEEQSKSESLISSKDDSNSGTTLQTKTVSRNSRLMDKLSDAVSFEGIKELSVDEIRATEKYRQWKPIQAEIKACISYYKQNNKFKECVEVFVKNNHYYVCGGFVSLYVATRQLKLKYVKCRCSTEEK